MKKQLSQFREDLLTRIIHIYGFEHKITIWFAQLLETQEENEINNKMLEMMVKCHEKSPMVDEDWECRKACLKAFWGKKASK